MTAGVGRQQQTSTKVFDNFLFDDNNVFNVSSVVSNLEHTKNKYNFYEDFNDEFYINTENSTLNIDDFDYHMS